MRQTHSFAVALAAVLSTALAATASARSLLYYYDFDMVDGSGHISSVENKGSGAAEAAFKMARYNPAELLDSEYTFKTDGGPFGSTGHSFWSDSSSRSIWLPAAEGNLGCSTTNGFTIATWFNYGSARPDWSDFMGFVVGSYRYFCEHTATPGEIALYGCIPGLSSIMRIATIRQPAEEWAHLAIVFSPARANLFCGVDVYLNGNLVTNSYARGEGHGVLKQVHLGATTKGQEDVRFNKENGSLTSIDEFALFDYPATAEQIKWLTKHKPGQPTGGPGREMPLCWRFEKIVNGYTRTDNSGTGNITTQHSQAGNGQVDVEQPGALGSVNAYKGPYSNLFTFEAIDDENGLGATVGSGFSFSFWLYAGATPSEWADFFGFYLGTRNAIHLEWTNRGNPRSFCAYGGNPSGEVTEGRVGSTWQHVALTYDAAKSAVDVYLDGVKRASTILQTPISQADCLKRITVGPASYYFDNNTLKQRIHTLQNTFVDELAFFNYSISPEEIAWLGSNIPRLPPLTATNLARTVSADCSWAGGLASWNVLDGLGADTGRRSIYPSCEDAEVEVAVSIAASATIANDTFVTPAKLKFTNGTGGASAAATLAAGANSMFAPENLEVGDGVTLTVAPGEVSVADTLTFGDGAKIVFDMSNMREGKIAKGISFGSTSLPSAESDLLSHFATRGGICEIILSDDGKTVNIKKSKGLMIFVR